MSNNTKCSFVDLLKKIDKDDLVHNFYCLTSSSDKDFEGCMGALLSFFDYINMGLCDKEGLEIDGYLHYNDTSVNIIYEASIQSSSLSGLIEDILLDIDRALDEQYSFSPIEEQLAKEYSHDTK